VKASLPVFAETQEMPQQQLKEMGFEGSYFREFRAAPGLLKYMFLFWKDF